MTLDLTSVKAISFGRKAGAALKNVGTQSWGSQFGGRNNIGARFNKCKSNINETYIKTALKNIS